MKRLFALAAVLTLAGCATNPAIQAQMPHFIHHRHVVATAKVPVPTPSPVVQAPTPAAPPAKPPSFLQRHPIKWLH